MSLIHERKLLSKEMKESDLVTSAIEVITKLEKKHNRYQVDGFDNDKYCATNPKYGKHFVVDLIAKTCSCMVWQLGGIRCVHAIAVIRPLRPSRESWSKWCNPYVHAEAFKGTYAGSIYPFDNEEDWGKLSYEDQYLPPPVERKAVRPKKQRIRDEDEERASSIRKCKLCNNPGHNQRTCPERPDKQSKKRKRKSKSRNTGGVAENEGQTVEGQVQPPQAPEGQVPPQAVSKGGRGSRGGRGG
ncbi:hypothetical protein IFM89_031006 [Coptis chinensis]|uniref:SWIM-type domain-containing protein n=1 Tax=Coptis chinensis TaxID=261450 RepID=A0A835H7U2_9MAGN|nr:hypothetical protein IFM89_031006 [Coptis chinensis]